jgi:hypothetical protein
VVAFFESPAGLQVLHRLYIALLFVMTLVGAGGTRRVALVLRLAGLDRWIASSEGATKAASTRMERAVGAYGAAERSRLAAEMPSRAISACEDETYHPKPCLVAIEPVSNFILLEQYSQGRDAESWNTALEQAVAGLPVVIEQVTSDEAKGIRAHVRDSLGAQASSDVFHVQHEVSRGTGPCLAAQVRQTQAAVEAAKSNLASVVADAAADDATPRGPGRPKDWTTRQATAQQAVEAAVGADGAAGENREQMRQAIRDIASAYHPFDLNSGAARDANKAGEDLQAVFGRIEAIANKASLPERCLARSAKARRVIPNLIATIGWVHRTIAACVASLALDSPVVALLHSHIIPGLYLQRRARQASTAQLRAALREQATRLLSVLQDAAGLWATLPPELQVAALDVAQACADLFQPSSSCVEGRNGQLALHHHHLHRLSSGKLVALTTVHNYFLARPDGTSAAERFFGAKPMNLFEHLCAVLPLPARPRARRSPPQARPSPRAAA